MPAVDTHLYIDLNTFSVPNAIAKITFKYESKIIGAVNASPCNNGSSGATCSFYLHLMNAQPSRFVPWNVLDALNV